MLKEYDRPKETALERATRKWRNNVVSRRIIEAQRTPKVRDVNTELKTVETLTNEGRRHGPINRLESKFKKELKAMLQGHADRNLALYAASLQHRKRRLLLEKLRRLEARQNQPQASNVQQHRDLFA
jgi:hypothetical protein